jgi:pyridinium-3,5-biscarboxylic acid mononucleotide sulfurtransferase
VNDTDRNFKEKHACLIQSLRYLERVVVAFSGGVDSAFLLMEAREALGSAVLAVTIRSPAVPQREYHDAVILAERIGVTLLTVTSHELEIPDFRMNPDNRCYLCKKALFGEILSIAAREGFSHVIEGSNWDDRDVYRPGMKALRELGIQSPLMDARLTKSEIRTLARDAGLDVWDKPSTPCLYTRIPYGEEITLSRLERIEKAEQYIFDLDIREFRVRDHGDTARIEVNPQLFGAIMEVSVRRRLVNYFRDIGYRNISLDLAGFRSGSMDEHLKSSDSEDGS